MEKEVLVTVSGLLFTGNDGEEKENVDVVAPGQYYLKNGKHYVLYDEVTEDFTYPIHNVIKASADEVSVRKSGLVNGELNFKRGSDTSSHYSTPYGSLVLGMHTNEMEIREEDNRLEIHVEYGLEINYEHASDCFIRILVQPRTENGGFTLV